MSAEGDMMARDPNATQNYTEENITRLNPREHIRLRPGMYVGGTDIRAMHHLVYEIVDNAIDEALAGRCDQIMVTLQEDNRVTITDNGVGIPVGIHRDTGKSTLEMVLTEVGTGGKFNNAAYKVSGGLHGVGAAAVNALSEEMTATIYRDGHVWQQDYRAGEPTTQVVKTRAMQDGEVTGTIISFKPDFTVLERNTFSYPTLVQRFREMAFVTRKVSITLRDDRSFPPSETTFYFEGGLRAFVRFLNRNRQALHEVVHFERDVQITPEGKEPYSIGVEIAFQYNDSANVTEMAFANTINTPDGGTHLTGLRAAITGVINRYARKAGFLKDKDPNFAGADTLEGLTAIVSIKHPHPAFESQTKVKLINPEVQGAVSGVITEAFMEYLEINPREARRIIDKCMISMRAREAARKARELVRGGPSLLESSTLPGKLADCSQHGENAEIYIVEGDSAGGSAKQGRDRHFQAILPLRGKILNTERARLDKMLDNNEIKALISALGTGVSDDFNVEGIRYGRVIIMSVAGDEPTLVRNARTGMVQAVRVGEFIDDCMNGRRVAADYEVMSFDNSTYAVRFRPLKAVIRHHHAEPMYRVTTRLGRSIKVTSSHSVFVLENGEVKLKRGSEVRPGDRLIASRQLPHAEQPIERIELNGAADKVTARRARTDMAGQPVVAMAAEHWQLLRQHRETSGMSQKQIAYQVGITQARTISQWERGENRPLLPQFRSYLAAIGWEGTLQYQVDTPVLESDVSGSDRFLTVTSELMWFLGWYAAKGSLDTDTHRVSLHVGREDARFVSEIVAAIEHTFGETPAVSDADDGIAIAFDSALAERLLIAVGMSANAGEKRLPDVVFGVAQTLQERFLEAYFLAAGTATGGQMTLCGASEDIRDGLLYLLGQMGIVASLHTLPVDESASLQDARFVIAIVGGHQLEGCSAIWQRHARADALVAHIAASGQEELPYALVGEDLMALEVLTAEEIAPVGEYVYDFSVEEDENFVCGVGGLCAHNTDADTDGSHIRTLLLTFFFRHMTPLIQNGHLYIAQPPIFRLQHGKDVRYIYPQAGMGERELLAQALAPYADPDKVKVSRYKGLGEMNPEQLWETTMDPQTRTLLQVTIEDAVEADHVFDMLMGSEVPPRRKFIQTHAKSVRNLDI
jgi:DNA gyrase subunit B